MTLALQYWQSNWLGAEKHDTATADIIRSQEPPFRDTAGSWGSGRLDINHSAKV